mmetsp:Transcript_94447/g.185232  ORF Transcript_94447/g.185232 Transcript_94447/m.185232 type:complete len:102 (+) Transcript_94447:1050-1355(+)
MHKSPHTPFMLVPMDVPLASNRIFLSSGNGVGLAVFEGLMVTTQVSCRQSPLTQQGIHVTGSSTHKENVLPYSAKKSKDFSRVSDPDRRAGKQMQRLSSVA